MSNKWMEIISNSKESSVVFDVSAWLSRATLDAMGEGKSYARNTITFFIISFNSAAFDVRFGSIDDNKSALARSYSSMMSVSSLANSLN